MEEDQALSKASLTPIADLKLANYNPRTISERMLDELGHSITTYGFLQPVIVNTTTDTVVGGHQRIAAALKLGWTEVPVIKVTLSSAQERALNVALNRIQGGWDDAQLLELLDGLRADLPDAVTGFSLADFRRLDAAAKARNKGGRDGITPKATKEGCPVQPGETYRLGRHLLHCGSAADSTSYHDLHGRKARLMCTDPPYNIAYTGGAGADRAAIQNDDLGEGFQAFLQDTLGAALAHNDGASYVFYASSQARQVHQAWVNLAGHMSGELQWDVAKKDKLPTGSMEILTWQKQAFVLGRSHYQTQHESILYGWHKGAKNKYWCGSRTESNVLTYPRPTASTEHPTMKPVALIEKLILNSTEPDDLVLEPFAGSGTTLIAAENTERECYAIELEPGYVEVIIRRYLSLEGAGDVELVTPTLFSTDERWWQS